MSNPSVILLADGFTDPDRSATAFRAIRAGVEWIHLRDHEASDEAFRAGAERFMDRIRQQHLGVRVSVNSWLHVAEALGAGYHGGVRGASPEEARERLGSEATIGYSAHEASDVTGPIRKVVDYFFYSPIFPTRSKPGHPGVGLKALAEVCTQSVVPVYALGGITPDRVEACMEAGATGVSVLSGMMEANDAAEAARAYLEAV